MNKLYIRQKVFKITDHYPVLNANEEVVYQVDQDFKLLGNTVRIQDASGRPLFVVDKVVFTFLPQYVIRFNDGQEIGLKSRFTLFHKAIDVVPTNLGIYLQGDFWDYNFSVYKGNFEIGSIRRVLLTWGDTYEITVMDERHQDLLVAMMIAVDCIKDSQQKN